MPVVGVQYFVIVIRFCVKVPVLSDAITSTLPIVSTALTRRMIAFLSAIRRTPCERLMVTMIGRVSGTAATANETPIIKLSAKPWFCTQTLSAKIVIPPKTANVVNQLDSRLSRPCNGVARCFVLFNKPAIWPNSVAIPVVKTWINAVPAVTAVPAYTWQSSSSSPVSW